MMYTISSVGIVFADFTLRSQTGIITGGPGPGYDVVHALRCV